MCKGRHCAHDAECFAVWPRLDLRGLSQVYTWPTGYPYFGGYK